MSRTSTSARNSAAPDGDSAFPTTDGLILVDMHAEATSEKMAMGHFCDGRASVVVGTHTHVPTADARVLPGGTEAVTGERRRKYYRITPTGLAALAEQRRQWDTVTGALRQLWLGLSALPVVEGRP